MQSLYMLPDSQWEEIKAIIEPKQRKRKVNLQVIVSGIIYLLSNGCKWDSLPPCYARRSQTLRRPQVLRRILRAVEILRAWEVLSILPNKFRIIFAIGREEADCDHSTVCLPCVAPLAVAGWRYFSALLQDRLVPSRAEKKAPAPFLQYVDPYCVDSSVHRRCWSSTGHT